MSFPVQVLLDEDNLDVRLGEIRDWLKQNHIETVALIYLINADRVRVRNDFALTYLMNADRVRVRVDFARYQDAVQFADAFSGIVYSAIPTV